MRVRYVLICERNVDCVEDHELAIIEQEKAAIIRSISKNQYTANEKFQIIVEKLNVAQ